VENYGIYSDIDNTTFTNGTTNNYGFYLDVDDDADTNYGIYMVDTGETNTYYSIWDDHTADWVLDADDKKIVLGESQEAEIYYSAGNELVIDDTTNQKINFQDNALTTTGQVNTANHYPVTDDTYYLGKNDDDSPYAWKGLILKDTANGKYYRIEVTNGVVTATDLTD
jgi:hypothetical protein